MGVKYELPLAIFLWNWEVKEEGGETNLMCKVLCRNKWIKKRSTDKNYIKIKHKHSQIIILYFITLYFSYPNFWSDL